MFYILQARGTLTFGLIDCKRWLQRISRGDYGVSVAQIAIFASPAFDFEHSQSVSLTAGPIVQWLGGWERQTVWQKSAE